MTRYKGQHRAARIEVEFPHHFDIIVPPGGLGTRLDAMYAFHAQHGIKPQRGHGKHNADGSIIRRSFCRCRNGQSFRCRFWIARGTFTSRHLLARINPLR